MARIGTSYVDRFDAARAAGYTVDDGNIGYYVTTFFASAMANAGHDVVFDRRETDVCERDLRDVAGGDDQVADRVDLYFISTHGVYDERKASLIYNVARDEWEGHSDTWRLGNNCNLEWLLVYGCHTIDKDDVVAHHPIFEGMHLMCGAYSYMYDSWTTAECGQDVADHLLSGRPVSDAWLDGASDWWVENHPCVIGVERQDTYGGPWSASNHASDHLWGHGTTVKDVAKEDQYWMSVSYNTSGVWDWDF